MNRLGKLTELLEVIAEDYRVHDSSPSEVGFFALAAHRAARWFDEGRPSERARASLVSRILSTCSERLVGIQIAPEAEIGRRLRIWHHGGMRIAARSIGDDVVLRQSTTFGPANQVASDLDDWPIIEDGVDVGSGACIRGGIRVGRGAFVGANALVEAAVAPGATMVGVPARPMPPIRARAPARTRADEPDEQAHADVPSVRGTEDQNPPGVPLLSLLKEDFQTHGSDFTAPGFWAVAIHRLGNRRMSVRHKLLRAPLTLAYRTAFQGVRILWGIDLPYDIRLGRRVNIAHHGSIHIGARAIGDDVVIRNTTSIGLVRTGQEGVKPTIGNRVEIGSGACIVGPVTIGDDCYLGPNTVVPISLPPGSTVLGVPVRHVDFEKLVRR
jgi:serine O-acetyltransferase